MPDNPMDNKASMHMSTEDCICNVRLARAYVPIQQFNTTFPPMEGLEKGTIFPELYMPFMDQMTTKHMKEGHTHE